MNPHQLAMALRVPPNGQWPFDQCAGAKVVELARLTVNG